MEKTCVIANLSNLSDEQMERLAQIVEKVIIEYEKQKKSPEAG